MGRKRKTNKHLPPRVYYKDGGYYFVDMDYKWHFLGNTLAAAMMKYGQLVENTLNDNTMHALFDYYLQVISPTKSAGTHRNNIYYIKNLRAYFGVMLPETVTAQDAYRYQHERAKTSVASANKEISLLNLVMEEGVKKGALKANVIREVKRLPEKITRDRYVEDWEFLAVYNLGMLQPIEENSFAMVACGVKIGYLTAHNLGDLVKIKITDLLEGGIYMQRNKTKKAHIVNWTSELWQEVEKVKKLRGNLRGFYLFCRRDGSPYTVSGFQSIWSRLRKLALNKDRLDELEKKLNVKIEPRLLKSWMFKDLRSKAATDIGIKHAKDLLQHSDEKTTQRHYIKKEELKTVNPVR